VAEVPGPVGRRAVEQRVAKAATAPGAPSSARRAQAVRAAGVAVEVVVVGVLQVGAVRGQAIDIRAQPRPARKPVLVGDDELRRGEPERLVRPPFRVVRHEAGACGRVAGAVRALEVAGAVAQLFAARA
jgi:hypothetical protein